MANQSPFSGAAGNSGGYLLPEDQGGILVNGLLQESGALAIAGDIRATSSRKTNFPIWLGKPTAEFVGEGETKPVTGGEFDTADLNVKKVASIVLFTDEQLEDVRNGDLNVLVDSGVRAAISDRIDVAATGYEAGSEELPSPFDSAYAETSETVGYDPGVNDGLRLAVSEALGVLEANGYRQNNGVLLGPDIARHLRDARAATESTTAIYDNVDPLYGLPREFSTNLAGISSGSDGDVVAFVVHRPNVHVRIRKDVTVDVSNQATVDGRSLWEDNLTGLRYETRLGMLIHDIDRAVVAIVKDGGS